MTHTHTHTHTHTQVMEQLHAELGMAHVQRQAQEEVEQHKLKLLRAQEDMSKWCVCERVCVYGCVFVCEREFMGNDTSILDNGGAGRDSSGSHVRVPCEHHVNLLTRTGCDQGMCRRV